MSHGVTIALDAMGGDFGPDVVVPAALRALEEDHDLRVTLVGDDAVLRAALECNKAAGNDRLKIHHASQTVGMDETPSSALRNKKDSSMRVAIDLVKNGDAGACVSAGNTGALMATARFVLKMLPGIDRPAICTSLPTMTGHTWMLDLGANVDCNAEHLLQFALMGSVLAGAVDNNRQPRIGLLNIGEEEIKGNDQVKEAARLLAGSPLNYSGYAEGDDIYKGTFDVIVCDGFVGNISLKSSEGVAKMIAHFIRQEFTRNALTRLAALIAMPVLQSFRKKIDPRRYNGASLLGLRGIVIKSHGSADVLSYANAIKVAVVEARESVPERISSQLQTFHENRQAS
jgi:glycerol-3-phosphate acyltransferase PlsX